MFGQKLLLFPVLILLLLQSLWCADKDYGNIRIEVKTAGELHLDGAHQSNVSQESVVLLEDIEAGKHTVQMRYQNLMESRQVEVEKGRTIHIVFTWTKAPIETGMVFIPGGTFMMGDNFNEGWIDEKPLHEVKLGVFYIGRYELTVGEFREFVEANGYVTTAEENGGAWVYTEMGWEQRIDANWNNPYFKQDDDYPVVNISWYDAIRYCNWLSEKTGLSPCYTIAGKEVSCDFTADGYRLPTEAEWEYAARSGGKRYRYSWGNGQPSGNIADETVKKRFSEAEIWEGYYDGYVYTAPVGRFRPNEMEIYDMTGNVWEWCWDWYNERYYVSSPNINPVGPLSGGSRVIRGGSWSYIPRDMRVSYRGDDSPEYSYDLCGFRLARTSR